MLPIEIITPAIEIRNTGTAKGRCVVSRAAYEEGSIVEICPVLVFDVTDFAALPLELRRVVFKWSNLIGKTGIQRAVPLGFGSLYNHANPANLRYRASRLTQTMTYLATRAIRAGEELTINYDAPSGHSAAKDSRWMKGQGVIPIE